MTRKQQLFLYRNIAYISRNNGQKYVFEWLMDNLMTQRGLPLAEYQMRHDLSNQPVDLRPIVKFRKNPINTAYNFDSKSLYTVEEVLNKEEPLARDNGKYKDIDQQDIVSKMTNSLSNKVSTKLLESTVIDYAGSEHFTLADTLINQWFYLSASGLYRTFVPIEMPSSGEILTIRANRALELYMYAYCKTIGITLTHLPKILTKRVLRYPRPTVDDLMSIVNPKVVPRSFAQQMLNYLPPQQQFVSTVSFKTWCIALQKAAMKQYFLATSEEKSNAKGQKYALMSRCWSNSVVQLGTQGQTYADWFTQQNINISNYSVGDLSNLAKEILNKALGNGNGEVITIRQIQAAMVKLMGQLGSYSTQYSIVINAVPILDAPSTILRTDNLKQQVNQVVKYPQMIGVVAQAETVKSKNRIDIGSKTFEINTKFGMSKTAHYELTAEPKNKSHIVSYNYADDNKLSYKVQVPEIDTGKVQIVPVPGIDRYLSMTDAQKALLKDIWTD